MTLLLTFLTLMDLLNHIDRASETDKVLHRWVSFRNKTSLSSGWWVGEWVGGCVGACVRACVSE